MTFLKIRLELARTPEFPEGSRQRGYDFVAPLDAEGRLDVEEWRHHRNRCKVRRFWEGEDDETGLLIHTRHNTWAFSYAPGEDDDEPVFRFDTHVFREGEYVSITEHDGVTRPFKVVSVH
ncbi:MAG TPA: hypothetical protein VI732_07795 [Alphaproteobacteria bacterium]|jgi:hypothetical protein|nr:hypothetical protein [Alphaproteobacteria bacterium]